MNNKTKSLVILLVFGILLFMGCFSPDNNKLKTHRVEKYICPMHRDYVSETKGNCPICGMALVELESVRGIPPIDFEEFCRNPSQGLYLSPSQAKEITLTLSKVSVEKIERWIRTTGTVNPTSKRVSGWVYGKTRLIQTGQKVRIFPLIGRDPVLQGKIIRIVPGENSVFVETDLIDRWYKTSKYYIMEIIIDLGHYIAIPNEAIIEEGKKRVVYTCEQGQYLPKTITIGHRGELYTQIIDGLKVGEEVVTFGSFFLDAEYKLHNKRNLLSHTKE